MARSLRWPLLAAALSIACTGARAAPAYTILYNFHREAPAIGQPAGPVSMGPDGGLFGVTSGGGANGLGTIYKLTPPKNGATTWTGTILYSFADPNIDASRDNQLAIGADGSLYGVRRSYSQTDNGAIFKLTPPSGGGADWTYAEIYTFKGGTDGADPRGAVAIDASGTLYNANNATIYKIIPPASGQTQWTRADIYTFEGPIDVGGHIVLNNVGGLYGEFFNTQNGFYGLYLINTAGGSKPQILRTGFSGGKARYGLDFSHISFHDGRIFGTAQAVGQHPAYHFCDSAKPVTCGAVFELSAPPNPRKVRYLHIFGNFLYGALPTDGVVAGPTGNLYGTTLFGGLGSDQSEGNGVVYSLTPLASGETDWTKTILHAFKGSPDGQFPEFGLTEDKAGAIYGVTHRGGSLNRGVVFKIVP